MERQGSPIGRVAMASLIGTTMEWYDFFLYGTAAALIFNRLFFPSFELLAGTLASFARPVGEIFFGHLGDRIGRRSILVPPEERRRATGEPAG